MSGSYRGVDPMGLIDSLQPAPGQAGLSSAQGALYYWNSSKPHRFEITVAENGSKVAASTFSRAETHPVSP